MADKNGWKVNVLTSLLLVMVVVGIFPPVCESTRGYTPCSSDKACKVYKQCLSWEDARDRCVSDGGNLAHSVTPEMEDWLKKKIGGLHHLLSAGLYKPANETRWFRADNGLLIPLPSGSEIKNSSGLLCGVFGRGFHIIGLPCTRKRPFFCKISYGKKSSSAKSGLPEGYHLYPGSNSAYKIFKVKKTFEEGQNRCVSDGGNLAIADTFEKIRFMNSISLDAVLSYVGFSKSDHSEEWRRVDDKSSVISMPWIREPAPQSRFNCAVTSLYGLRPTDCNWQHGSICEIYISANDTSSVGRK